MQTHLQVGVHEFFEMFWPDEDLVTVFAKTNRYEMQSSFDRRSSLNGQAVREDVLNCPLLN